MSLQLYAWRCQMHKILRLPLRTLLTSLLVLVLAWTLGPLNTALAAGAAISTTNPQATVTVNGRISGNTQAQAQAGDKVCVLQEAVYKAERQRSRFDSWRIRDDAALPLDSTEVMRVADRCVDVSTPSLYTAYYVDEVLLEIRSAAPEYEQTRWVQQGQVVQLSVPKTVESANGARYRFLRWDRGESPQTPENRIVALEPLTVTPAWQAEHHIEVTGPEGGPLTPSGWYADGSSISLRATPTLTSSDGTRRSSFVRWLVTKGTVAQVRDEPDASSSAVIDGPATFQALYRTEYLVKARSFQGVLMNAWVPEGEQTEISAPTTVETVANEERYVFLGWDGLPLASNRVTVLVEGPIDAEALFQRQFMVDVSSQFGAFGIGWRPEGERTLVRVPERPQSILFFHRVFDGWSGYDSTSPTITLTVDKPVHLVAIYHSEVDVALLFITLTVFILGVAAYVGTSQGPAIRAWAAQRNISLRLPTRKKDS